MTDPISSALEFLQIRATDVSRYQELRIRITLDGNIQESLESTLDAGVHTWREPFAFVGNSVSQCEIHILAKKRKIFCCAGRYKVVRTTRPQSISELLDTSSSDGVIRLPLYDSTRTDPSSTAMGSIAFSIVDTALSSDSLKHLPTRGSISFREEPFGPSSRPPFPEAVLEKLSLAESESKVPLTRSKTLILPATSPIHCPSNVPLQPPSPSPDVLTPQYLQTTTQLPQCGTANAPQKSGVDRIMAEMGTLGDVGLFSDDKMTAVSLLADEEDNLPGLSPCPAEIGSFTPVICEPPEDMASEGLELSLSVPQTTEPTYISTYVEDSEHGTIPQISITLANPSRGNSPLAPSSCDSEVTIKRPSVHVDTLSATQGTSCISSLSISPGFGDELSPFSRPAALGSPQPKTSTTNTSGSGLSPFSRTSIVESPSTAATTPAQSAISESSQCALSSPSSKQRKERPTIDTSCVGPRGQVRKYRNGSVPPVHVPVKLRNSSLDLPRPHEYEKFEPNPSMYSIAPSTSPRQFQKGGDLRCSSTQAPASRQGIVPSTRAPSIRREALEFDEAQICLDTANLGDQEVATFLKEVDAALSAIVNGSPAVAADSRAFLAVPNAASRLVSRHQSRKPSSQHLRADLSATVRSHEKENAARTGFSLVATSHPPAHPDVIPSRAASPLFGHTDTIPRLLLSQVDIMPGSKPGTPAQAFARVSPQPSPRHELVEWAPSSFLTTVSRPRERLSRPGSYYGDVNGNETIPEGVKLEIPPRGALGTHV